MKKEDDIYLKHIYDSIEWINKYLTNKSYDDFLLNHLLQDGIIRQIEIIGEATKRLSKDFTSKYNNIPWRQISGMRDKLIHDYFGVDIDAVWETATKDILVLKKILIDILNQSDIINLEL